jgi:capsular polysaccharide biosynthesis protein/predicted TPR repeat methyltransferase
MGSREQAQAAIAAKQWKIAEPLLQEVLATSPDSGELHFLLGQTRFKLGKYAAAETALHTALNHLPEDSPCLFYLSLCALAAGHYPEAISRFEHYLQREPEDVEAWKQLGMAHSALKGHAAALAAFEQARQRAPQDLACLRHLYRLQFLLNRDEDCRVSHHQALMAEGAEPGSRQLTFARVVSTETWELLANNWVQLNLKSIPANTTRIRPSLTRHDRARLITPEWLVLTANNDLLIEQMTHNPSTLPTKGPHVPALGRDRGLLEFSREPDLTIDDACILVGGSTHYYHWLVDFLPRIGIAHKVPALRDLKLLIQKTLAPWQWESLEALGIARDQLVEIADNQLVQCRALWVPTLLTHVTTLHPYVAGWLRRRLLTREMKSHPPRRLFVLPPENTPMLLANKEAISICLEKFGFETVIPEEMTFVEQVAAFAVAEKIVALSLPALANLLFAPAGAQVIEIQSPTHSATFFQALALAVGVRYRSCLARQTDDRADSALHLDPDDLLRILQIDDEATT